MLDQCQRRWADVVQMLYKWSLFAGRRMHVAVNVVGACRRDSVVLMLRHRCQLTYISRHRFDVSSRPTGGGG